MTDSAEFEAITGTMPDVWRTSAQVAAETFLAELRGLIADALTTECRCPRCVSDTPEAQIFWLCHHAVNRFRKSADYDAVSWMLVAALAELQRVAPPMPPGFGESVALASARYREACRRSNETLGRPGLEAADLVAVRDRAGVLIALYEQERGRR